MMLPYPSRLMRALIVAMLTLPLISSLVSSNDTKAEAEIRQALHDWTSDFNARNTSRICDLFSAALRYDYRGFPERGYDEICAMLKRSLSDPNKHYSYAPEIKEIVVAGDLAVVRIVWTLTVTENGTKTQTREPGMDLFQRQPDGRWKIIRYIAYEI